MNRGRPRYDDVLTPREWEVLGLLEAGLTNEEIAQRLGISFGTAKYHVAEIISKLGVTSREEAPAAARKRAPPVVLSTIRLAPRLLACSPSEPWPASQPFSCFSPSWS